MIFAFTAITGSMPEIRRQTGAGKIPRSKIPTRAVAVSLDLHHGKQFAVPWQIAADEP